MDSVYLIQFLTLYLQCHQLEHKHTNVRFILKHLELGKLAGGLSDLKSAPWIAFTLTILRQIMAKLLVNSIVKHIVLLQKSFSAQTDSSEAPSTAFNYFMYHYGPLSLLPVYLN